jgi:hypothetical protein
MRAWLTIPLVAGFFGLVSGAGQITIGQKEISEKALAVHTEGHGRTFVAWNSPNKRKIILPCKKLHT